MVVVLSSGSSIIIIDVVALSDYNYYVSNESLQKILRFGQIVKILQ